MDYADLVIATIVVVFPLSIAVLVALGASTRISIGVGAMVSLGVVFHALFVSPPGDRRSS